MSNHDRSIAADVQRQMRQDRDDLVNKASAYWYACGYNDHRNEGETYIDPQAFVDYWCSVVVQPSHRSLQDTFTLFVTLVTT